MKNLKSCIDFATQSSRNSKSLFQRNNLYCAHVKFFFPFGASLNNITFHIGNTTTV